MTTDSFNVDFFHLTFQRDENTEGGNEVYLYYNEDFNRWRLASGTNFRAKNNQSWMYFESLGKTKSRLIVST